MASFPRCMASAWVPYLVTLAASLMAVSQSPSEIADKTLANFGSVSWGGFVGTPRLKFVSEGFSGLAGLFIDKREHLSSNESKANVQMGDACLCHNHLRRRSKRWVMPIRLTALYITRRCFTCQDRSPHFQARPEFRASRWFAR